MATIRQIPPVLIGAVALIYLPCAAQSAQVNANQTASISGTVQSDAGVLEDASVSVFQVATSEGWARLAKRCSVETNTKGSYQCTGLTPGKYFVLASGGESPEEKSKSEKQASPYAFFPSSSDLDDAGEIVVGAGQLQSADIFLKSGDLHTVSCRVSGHPRRARARLLARTTGKDGTLVADTGIRGDYDEKRGEVQFEKVPHGSFEAVAGWRAGREGYFGEADVSVQSADVAGIFLEEQRPVSLEGTVTVDPGTSGSKITLWTILLYRSFDSDLVPAANSTQINPNGSFRFPSVLPGKYFLAVVSSPLVYVESSSISGLSKNGSVLIIDGSSENLTVQVDASTQVGSIAGVVNELPEGTAKAGVLVQSEDTGQVFTTTVDQSGKFMVSGLGPGNYRIYSWPDLYHMAYRDPSVLNQYADSAVSVILQSDAMNQSVNVNLIQNQ